MTSPGLNLLSCYDSDDDNSENENSNGKKVSTQVPSKRKLLPLPSEIKGLFEKETKELCPDDDPSLHEFRVRSFQHVRGNWASYIYAPVYKFDVLQETISNLFGRFGIDAKAIAKPHISVSKVVVLQHVWIDGCVANLRRSVSSFPEFGLAWKNDLACFVNEERTRTFVGLAVAESSSKYFSPIVKQVDQVLADYKLDKFYDPPVFHVSLLWLHGDHKELIETNLKLMKNVDLVLGEFLNNPDDNHQTVDKLFFKTGHKVFELPLTGQV